MKSVVSRRLSRRLMSLTAHVVLLGMLFQVAAFDHWQKEFKSVVGVEGTNQHLHASHCHGDSAGCAGGGASGVAIATPASLRLPGAPVLAMALLAGSPAVPPSAFTDTPVHPPQHA